MKKKKFWYFRKLDLLEKNFLKEVKLKIKKEGKNGKK